MDDKQSFYHLFHFTALKFKNKTAMKFGNLNIDFNQALEQVETFASHLETEEMSAGSVIGAFLENGFAMPLVALSCSKLGATIIPLATSLKYHQVDKIMKVASPDCLIVTEKNKSKILFALNSIEHQTSRLVVLKSSSDTTVVEVILFPKPKFKFSKSRPDCFVLNFTSGSTGNPKPVCISEKAKLARVQKGTIELFDLSFNDTILVSTPQYHSLGFRQSLLPLILGATAIILHSFSPRIWVNAILKDKVSFTISVSSQLAQIINAISPKKLRSIDCLRTLVSSSAPFNKETRDACLRSMHCDIYEVYGASEAGIATIKKLNKDQKQDNSVGWSPHYVDIKIFDVSSKVCVQQDGVIGEIGIKSPTNFNRYFMSDSETTKQFLDGYFLTGDLGYFVDQELFFSGRAKDTIQNGGITVYPADVENVVREFNGIVDACVVGILDEFFNEKIHLVYVSERSIDENSLYRFLFLELPEWQLPKKIKKVNTIPLSLIGKVDRDAVKNIFTIKQ